MICGAGGIQHAISLLYDESWADIPEGLLVKHFRKITIADIVVQFGNPNC